MKDSFYLLLFDLTQKFSESPYIKILLIFLLSFIFIILFAYVQKRIFQISFKGAVFGFFLGVVLMLILDLIVVVAFSDREKIKKLFSPKNRQEAVWEILISGAENLNNKILGASAIISPRKPKTAQEVISDILFLPDEEARRVKNLICPE